MLRALHWLGGLDLPGAITCATCDGSCVSEYGLHWCSSSCVARSRCDAASLTAALAARIFLHPAARGSVSFAALKYT